MKKHIKYTLTILTASLLVSGAFVRHANAAEPKSEDVIKEFMKKYHKAPKGVDPVCKKATDGQASADELKKLVEGYAAMAKAKAPQGDAASWKEKTTALLAAAKALQKGEPGAAAKYKDAVNCKACHSLHKPE